MDKDWVMRVAASAAIRRVVVVLVMIVLGWVGLGRAHAQSVPDSSQCGEITVSGTYCGSEDEARAVVAGFAEATKQALINGPYGGTPNATVCPQTTHGPTPSPPYGNTSYVRQSVSTNADCTALAQTWTRTYVVQEECPGGYKRDLQGQCMNEDKCRALNNEPGFDPNEPRDFNHAKDAPNNGYCPASGCAFVRTGQLGGTICVDGMCTTTGSWNYPGPSCSSQPTKPNFKPLPPEGLTDPPDPHRCTPIGGNQGDMCVKPDGKKCIAASTGKDICWMPTETGEKSDGVVLQKVNAGDTPIPPKPLDSGDTLVIKDPAKTVTQTQTTATGTTNTTTTVANYTTANGTSPKPGSTPKPGSGSDAEGEGEDDEGDGAPGPDVAGGRMDGAEGRTVDGVVTAFKNRMQGAPVVNMASNFFTVNASGTCPVWTIPATAWSPGIPMDFWCRPELAQAWAWFGYVMLLVFGFVGFRWAVL